MVKQQEKGQGGTTPTPEAPKRERKVLTAEERIAKLEADLATARAKAQAKADKANNELREKRAKLVAKRDELSAKIEEIDGQLQPPPADTTGDDSTADPDSDS